MEKHDFPNLFPAASAAAAAEPAAAAAFDACLGSFARVVFSPTRLAFGVLTFQIENRMVSHAASSPIRWHVMEAFYVEFVLSFSTFDVD